MKSTLTIFYLLGVGHAVVILSFLCGAMELGDVIPFIGGFGNGLALSMAGFHLILKEIEKEKNRSKENETPGGHLFDEEGRCLQCGNLTTDDPESCESVQLRKGSVT